MTDPDPAATMQAHRYHRAEADGTRCVLVNAHPFPAECCLPYRLAVQAAHLAEALVAAEAALAVEQAKVAKFDVEHACAVMHDAYEAAAVGAGWETQQASRKPWAEVPEANKTTMRAAVTALLAALTEGAADT